MSAKGCVLWETEMKSPCDLYIMTGFPFDFVCSDASCCSGECFWWCVAVCCGVSLFTLVISCMMRWRKRWLICGFVDKSPALWPLQLWFYNEWLGWHPWHTTNRENPLMLVYWESRRLSSVSVVWLPSPYDLFLAACTTADDACWACVKAGSRDKGAVAILPLCFGNTPVASIWYMRTCDITWVAVTNFCLI